MGDDQAGWTEVSRRQMPEGYRAAYRAASRQGWTVTRSSAELCWQPPRGKAVIMPFTPGTKDEIRHELARLKHAGLKSISKVHGSVRAVSGGLPSLGKR